MNSSGFGKNRLAAGFTKLANGNQQNTASPAEPSVQTNSHGESDEPIEISDDEEMTDSDGGIVLNIEEGRTQPVVISDDDSDEGICSPTDSPDAQVHSTQDGEETFVIDTKPSQSQTRLTDLKPDQLENQFKYALYHLNRDQIDLNRPATCLHCFAEGHIADTCPARTCDQCGAYNEHDSRYCPQGANPERRIEVGQPQSFFPVASIPPAKQLKLWISCCMCSSKTHLVGDCPETDGYRSSRWSLKALDSNQIVNLSLETGTKKLEREAEARGMRPAGLKIKGRAGLHQVGGPGKTDSDDEEDYEFLRSSVRRNGDNGIDSYRPGGTGRQDRYDRYDPPSDERSYRPPRHGYYQTDSFGRRRSRSPESNYRGAPPSRDRWSNSPPTIDRWRPGDRRTPSPGRYFRNSPPRNRFPPTQNQPSKNGRSAAPTAPRPTFQMQLPTRKGSNNWTSVNSVSQPDLPRQSQANANGSGMSQKNQDENQNSGNNAQSKKKKGKKQSKKK